MGKIQVNPFLLKRLQFLQKHANKAQVTRNGIASRHINIDFQGFSNCEFGIETKELNEMLKHTEEFEIENNLLKYSYVCGDSDLKARIIKEIPLFDLAYLFNFNTPISSLKLPFFKLISTDETSITFSDGKLIFETNEYVKTRLIKQVQLVDGLNSFRVKAKGSDLKIIEEIEGARVLCYFDESLVVLGYENDICLAVVIKSLA
jgi:hypothetical protein